MNDRFETPQMLNSKTIARWLLLITMLTTSSVWGQDVDQAEVVEAEPQPVLTEWDRLIYVPFTELQKVFDNQDASAVIPYGEYLQLMKNYLNQPEQPTEDIDAVITESRYDATVEKDIVRINAELTVTVLQKDGWARLPLNFGSAAVGKVTSDDQPNTILQGVSDGKYELLVKGTGTKTVNIDLLASIKTSPEHRSFRIDCPAVGISELNLTIPEADQSVKISPIQVLLPTEGTDKKQTVVRARLGAAKHFEVKWNPKAGSRPVMDLLATAVNTSNIRIEAGLLQNTTILDYEILRGELTELSILVPVDDRIIDVVSTSGRIASWKAVSDDDVQQALKIELLTPVSDKFRVEIQTERSFESSLLQLTGKSNSGHIMSVHADGVVRESGRLNIATDEALTTIVTNQSGVKRIDAATNSKRATDNTQQTWEFSGTSGVLVVEIKPVEPRLLADQNSTIVFDDDELRLSTRIVFTVERTGVFKLNLQYPESLTIDSVQADGMSEFNVDKSSGRLTLSLTEKRLGKINVDIRAHQPFDAAAEAADTDIPSIIPLNVERESGRINLLAPLFLDVITDDEKLTGLFPADDDTRKAQSGRTTRVAAWKYTQRPIALAVQTTPRPAQMSTSVATTATIDPAYMTVDSLLTYDIQNAGLDTFRVAVPEAVDHVTFGAVNSKIQQQEKAEAAVEGWVTWTIVLPQEMSGRVQLTSEWKTPLEETQPGVEQSIRLTPVRVLPPFEDSDSVKRRVTVTQTRGEMRLLRDESLSIRADGDGDTVESIDVRELTQLSADGYLAFRYFSQPAAATVHIKKHEIHQVVQTVISRAAVEVVTDKQQLASYRCRLKIISSERQRLRIDLPASADLQSPLINANRTTLEVAADVESPTGWTAYYVNVSREGTSDQEFLLTLQFRCPIADANQFPYEGQGSKQLLRLPLIGDNQGGTVVQETRVAIWSPKDIALVGKPANWSLLGRQDWSFWNPMISPSAPREAQQLDTWIGKSASAPEFTQQGNVVVYRALGRLTRNAVDEPQSNGVIRIVWWNRPFLVAIISGALLFAGFILRRTTWENRLTLTLLGVLAIALWSLKDASETLQFVSAGSLGLVGVAGIWLTSLFLGQKPESSANAALPTAMTEVPPVPNRPTSNAASETVSPETATPAQASDAASSVPWLPGAVTPSPAVVEDIQKLMGGK